MNKIKRIGAVVGIVVTLLGVFPMAYASVKLKHSSESSYQILGEWLYAIYALPAGIICAMLFAYLCVRPPLPTADPHPEHTMD